MSFQVQVIQLDGTFCFISFQYLDVNISFPLMVLVKKLPATIPFGNCDAPPFLPRGKTMAILRGLYSLRLLFSFSWYFLQLHLWKKHKSDTHQSLFIWNYYMASSVSGQHESNPAVWLATQAGKMELSCPLRTTCRVPQEKFPWKSHKKSFIDQTCSVKITGYWPHSFFTTLWSKTNINTQKRTWPISSHLDLTLVQ